MSEMSEQINEPRVPVDVIIGTRVHELLWSQRLKQRDLGVELTLGSSALSKKLRGERKWTAEELIVAADFLNVDVGSLMPRRGEFLSLRPGEGWLGDLRREGTAREYDAAGDPADSKNPRPVTGGSLFVMDEFGTASGTRTPNPLIRRIPRLTRDNVIPIRAVPLRVVS